MLNRDGISKSTYGSPKQILANVDLQSSVGCIVAKDVGTTVGAKKIAKAGTPIKIDMGNLQTPATAEAEGNNAVLLHDVDVTDGNANGTALVFGFVNVNRLESDVQAKVTPGTAVGMVQFIKF